MQEIPKQLTGDDGLSLPLYVVYNIGNSNPKNLLDFVQIFSRIIN